MTKTNRRHKYGMTRAKALAIRNAADAAYDAALASAVTVLNAARAPAEAALRKLFGVGEADHNE